MWVGSGCGWGQAVGGALKNVKSFSLEEGVKIEIQDIFK